jgi:Predicted acetyltransferase involved in intracellular survival and related acetyltransferases
MPEGQYKTIEPEYRDRFMYVSGHAFNYIPEPNEITDDDWANCRGWFVDGELVAQLETVALRIRSGVGDHEVNAIGFGGVTSPPEQRRRGYIRELLKAALLEARSNGINFCLLHPFKHSFYAQFGWAAAMEQRIFRGDINTLKNYRLGEGKFVPITPERSDEMQSIALRALRGRWGVTVRTAAQWKSFLPDAKRKRHGVIWRDNNGLGRAYVVYTMHDRVNQDRKLECHEALACDPEARAQLLAFLANHDSQASEIQLLVPSDAPLNLLLRDPIHSEVRQWMMMRVIDVERALNDYALPSELSGSCVIGVNDHWLEFNRGNFKLEASEGKLSCQRSDEAADVTLDVGLLGQWITRYVRPRQAAAFGLCSVQNKAALAFLDSVFSSLAPFNNDFF